MSTQQEAAVIDGLVNASSSGKPASDLERLAGALKVSLAQLDSLGNPISNTPKVEGGAAQPAASEAQKKFDEEADKVIDNKSANIQKLAEKEYDIHLKLARKDQSYLKELLDSGDESDREYLKKLLKRNSQEFGVSNVDDFERALVKSSAGEDPAAQKFAEQDLEIRKLRQNQNNSDWLTWKRSRQVEEGNDFDQTLNSVRSEYPSLPFVDVLNLAKGRMGLSAASSMKVQSSAPGAGGAAGVPTREDVLSSPLARIMLRDRKGSDTAHLKNLATSLGL